MNIYRGPKHNGGLYSTIAVALLLFIIIYCLIPDRNPQLPDAALIRLLDTSIERKVLLKIDSVSTYDYYVIIKHSNPWGAARVMAVKDDSLLIRALHDENQYWDEIRLANILNSPYRTFKDVWVSRKIWRKLGEGRFVKDPALVKLGLDSSWILEVKTVVQKPEMRVVFYQKHPDSDLWVIRCNWVEVQILGMKDYNNNVNFLKKFPFMLTGDTGALFATRNPGKDQYEKIHFDLTCRYRTDSIFTFTVSRRALE